MTKVLMVCLGNICRSPMAEAVSRQMIKEQGLEGQIEVKSRGTSGLQAGKVPHEGTQKKLNEFGISFENIYSEHLQPADFYEFDYLIGMDQQNVKDMLAIAPKGMAEKVHLFLSVLPESHYTDVPDPYYTGDFDLTYDLVSEASASWLAKLK